MSLCGNGFGGIDGVGDRALAITGVVKKDGVLIGADESDKLQQITDGTKLVGLCFNCYK